MSRSYRSQAPIHSSPLSTGRYMYSLQSLVPATPHNA